MPCTRTGIPLRSIPAGDGHVIYYDGKRGNEDEYETISECDDGNHYTFK